VEQENLTPAQKQRAIELIKQRERKKQFSQLEEWSPYGWQQKLANSSADNNQMLAMCGNRTGKSYTGSRVVAAHLTGRYPDWWEGHRFTKPIQVWAAGASTVTTRDILQKELLGPPTDQTMRGSGSIPLDDIVDVIRKPQIPNAVESIVVKFHNKYGRYVGNSILSFKSYEMGEEKFMGESLDWIWLDEQPAQNIYTQCLTRTLDKKGFVMMTFTPEQGMTPVIHQFKNDRKKGQFLVQAGWDEAPHLDEDAKEQILAQYLPNEREMRVKGEPVFGSGMVFPYSLDDIVVDDFDIPDNWERICGIDFGWEHPTAVVWMAIDPTSNRVILYDEHRESKATPTIHAAAIKARPTEPPIAWPHDGNRTFDGGDSLSVQYTDLGCNFLPEHFTNPPATEQKKGDIKISTGILALNQAMEQGTFKVFKSCVMWQEEYQTYHYDQGKIVDDKDDLMAATRYAYQSRRFASKPTNVWSSMNKFNKQEQNLDWVV
jgi:phage terminase large subunit-like protein